VERDELKAASALQFSFHNMASLAGPALAGVLIAAAGLTATYGVDVVELRGLARRPQRDAHASAAARTPSRPSWRTIREGLRYATLAPGPRRDLPDRHERDVLRHADGALPGHRQGLRRAGGLGLLYAAPSAGSIA
jgi:hypothetical protein